MIEPSKKGFQMAANLIMAAGMGIIMGAIFCWFGEVITPDDLV